MAIIKPGDAKRAAERNVARLVKYAERFDPLDRHGFFLTIYRQL
jgi:hypothetical protein